MGEDTAHLALRDDHIEALRRSLSSAEHGLGAVPSFIKIVVRECGWRDRLIRQTGQRASFSSFAELVTAPPLEGLGATLDQLRGLCRDDMEALDAIEHAIGTRQGVRHELHDNVTKSAQGGSTEYALRRLRKDRPDLHARVLAKELTPHAAMIEAGFRKPSISVQLTVDSLFRQIAKLSDKDQSELYMRMGTLIDDICMREPSP